MFWSRRQLRLVGSVKNIQVGVWGMLSVSLPVGAGQGPGGVLDGKGPGSSCFSTFTDLNFYKKGYKNSLEFCILNRVLLALHTQ